MENPYHVTSVGLIPPLSQKLSITYVDVENLQGQELTIDLGSWPLLSCYLMVHKVSCSPATWWLIKSLFVIDEHFCRFLVGH